MPYPATMQAADLMPGVGKFLRAVAGFSAALPRAAGEQLVHVLR